MFREEADKPARPLAKAVALPLFKSRPTPLNKRLMRSRRSSAVVFVSLLFLMCALASGCGRGDVVVTRPPAEEKLKIGAFMSLTGDTAQYGISALNGIRMAVEEANASGGVRGHRVELIVQDTRSDVVETEVVVRRLAGEYGVHALVGEIVSSRSLRAAGIAQAERVPMLTPSSTSPEVTKQGDYIFRSCYTDPFQGAALAQFAARTLHAHRAALLVDGGERYSIELARVIREEFTRQGGEVVIEQSYSKGAGDFSVELAEVGAARPEVIFIPGYYLEAGLLARQAKQLDIPAPLVGGDGWDSPRLYEIGGQALAGDFFSSHFSADDPDPQVQRFVEDYRRLFGNAPDAFAATAYDAARIMLAACARAASLDRTAIRDALAETTDFFGVTGTVTFNSERNAVKPIVIIRIGDAGRQSVEAHIKPSDIKPLATPTPSPTPQKKRRRK
jgi:branched-chain amino acid transport system substrate-binding protein